MGKYPLYTETPVPPRERRIVINKEYYYVVVLDDEGVIVKFRRISVLGVILFGLRFLRLVF